MLTAALFATALLFDSSQVAVITSAPPPAQPATTAEPAADMVRVCRWEAETGSNRRNRVCRDVPRQAVQDQQTREFMRDRQRWTPPPSG